MTMSIQDWRSIADTVETPRLVLRALQETDVADFMAIHEDPEVMKFIQPGVHPGTVTSAWRTVALMIGHWHLRGYGQWAIVEKATSALIGRVGLWNPEGWPGVELGWVIRRSRWEHGFATEAARAALAWTWNRLDVDHIISLIEPANTRSIRVAEKIGERLERHDTLNDRPVHVYGIRREGRP